MSQEYYSTSCLRCNSTNMFVCKEGWECQDCGDGGEYNIKTDIKRLIGLYDSIGVKYEKFEDEDENILGVSLPESISQKFIGLVHYGYLIHFTKEGKFIKQGFWE